MTGSTARRGEALWPIAVAPGRKQLDPGEGQTVTADDLRQYARGVLAHFKVPTAFTFVESLPKTATGKVQKFVLRGGKAGIARQ